MYFIFISVATKSSTLKVAAQKPPFPGGSENDVGVDVLSLNVPSKI